MRVLGGSIERIHIKVCKKSSLVKIQMNMKRGTFNPALTMI